MVDIGGTLSGVASGATKGIGGTFAVLAKAVPIIIVGLIIGFILWKIFEDIILFKHKVKLKKIVGRSYIWVEDKAMEKRLKNGARYWHFKKLKIKKSLPPNEVLIHDSRGKMVAFGYLVNDNQVIWTKDDFNLDNLKEEVNEALAKSKKGEELSYKEESLLVFDSNFQPVSTNDKIILADAMEEADFGKKDLSKIIEKAIPWIVVITLFVIFIFSFKYFAGPLNEMAQESLETVKPVAEMNKQTAEILYSLKQDIQLINQDISLIKKGQEKILNVSSG